MAVKMRVAKEDCKCLSCGVERDKSLDMFDVMIGDKVLHICDVCMRQLNERSLNAVCYTNGRVKQPREVRIANMRRSGNHGI